MKSTEKGELVLLALCRVLAGELGVSPKIADPGDMDPVKHELERCRSCSSSKGGLDSVNLARVWCF